MTTVTLVELRCPEGPRRLLAKLRQAGERPVIVPGNLFEVSCRDCAKNARQLDDGVERVLHRFNLLGELVESAIEHS